MPGALVAPGIALLTRPDALERCRRLRCIPMAAIVLRVRLISGENMDVTFDQQDEADEDTVVDHVISTLAEPTGVLRCQHGNRLLVLYARGVAAIEVAPRGAII